MISPLVKMLQGDDKHLRSTTASLLKRFASHGGSFFSSILPLLTVITENPRSAILESGMIFELVDMFKDDDHSVRSTAVDVFKDFLQHGKPLLSSFLPLLITV